MTQKQMLFIVGLLACSVLFLVVPAVSTLLGKLIFRRKKEENRSPVSMILVFSGCLLVSIWCLRYAVGYYSLLCANPEDVTLTWWEEVFNSIAHAMQTFSMDEDYTGYILSGKEMIRNLLGGASWWELVYGAYASALNFLAPIAGGAMIFEIIAGIFPRLRLRLSFLAVWREKYYFSEINEASLALAKSVRDSGSHRFKPILIFTDTYLDKENELDAEVLLEAKKLGAICLRDDLSHVIKNRWGKRRYFLIDEMQMNNLQALIGLTDEQNYPYLRHSTVYVFCEDSRYAQVERQLMEKLQREYHLDRERGELPTFVPVRNYRSLATNLLVNLPLYEPLVQRKQAGEKDLNLNVTIFGSGTIGTEIFLATYWMGQMLDCSTHMHVVSECTEQEFWGKIDYINPEIRKTTDAQDPILRYSDRGSSKPYVTVSYQQCDLKTGAFWQTQDENSRRIMDTDYFVVALGSDADNISVAEKLHQHVGQAHVATGVNRKTVIAYVVYNTELCETLNRKRCFCSSEAGKPDIYMHAFGTLGETYSCENIFMTQHAIWAKESGEAYMMRQRSTDQEADNIARVLDANRDYTYWANLARAMHVKYKVFSLGWVDSSIFDSDVEDKSGHRSRVADACARYRRVASNQMDEGDQWAKEVVEAQKHRLAWLEHRRWNSFTRVMGFRCSDAYLRYYHAAGDSVKHMELKLHPCLVECDEDGIRARFLADGTVDESTAFLDQNRESFDALDLLSYDLYEHTYVDAAGKERRFNSYDYKQYDYPAYEFDRYYTLEEAAKVLEMTEKQLQRLCRKGKMRGAAQNMRSGQWVIPGKTVKMMKSK